MGSKTNEQINQESWACVELMEKADKMLEDEMQTVPGYAELCNWDKSQARSKRYREKIAAAERAVTWKVWPGEVVFGPGRTREEIEEQADKLMRSGWWRGGSSDYHRIRLAPNEPIDMFWQLNYPKIRVGRDPRADVSTEQLLAELQQLTTPSSPS